MARTTDDVLSTVRSVWGAAGTNLNKAATVEKAATRDVIAGAVDGLRREGMVAASLGGTQRIPEFATVSEGTEYINTAIKEHQMKRHAGIPVDPRSGRVQDSYAFKRREALIESEGNRGTKVYRDHKGLATVGIGINLEADHNADFIQKHMAGTADDYIEGRRSFTQEQVDILFDHNMALAERAVNQRLGAGVALTSNQRISLVSLAFNNPALIGPNLSQHVRNGDWKAAEAEIRERSNRNKHRGIQNRRNREADLFALDTHDPAPHVIV